MALDTISSKEKAELDALEERLQRKNRLMRLVVALVVVAAIGGGAWLATGLIAYTPPEPSPLEKLLTQDFTELQLDWFDTLSASSRVNPRMLADRKQGFAQKSAAFLDKVKQVEPTLHGPFETLVNRMASHDQVSLLAETPAKALAQPLSAINEVLADLEPRFILDAESFEGLLDNHYLVGAMVCVYEVLDILTLEPNGDEPVELQVVRRRDSLPADSARRGFVRLDDTSAAFVLQDNATSFAADYVFPSFERPDAAFESRFNHAVPDSLKEPFRVLLELVQLELREASGAQRETFEQVAANVASRARIFSRVEESCKKLGVHLRKPDGLLWPRSFASRVLLENTEANKKGNKILYDSDRDKLIEIARALDNEATDEILRRVTEVITTSVGYHESRHVIDLRAERETSRCIRQRVRITDDDPDFLRQVDLEARAYLTQIIESPESVRLTLLTLLTHLYRRSGTVYFYAARTLLHPLAFTDEDESIPRGWNYMEEITLRLAAADPAALATRARAFWQECFEEPYPELNAVTRIPIQQAGGCSVTRW